MCRFVPNGRSRSKPLSDHGVILPLVGLLIFTTVSFCALAANVSYIFERQQTVQGILDNAARAGAEKINEFAPAKVEELARHLAFENFQARNFDFPLSTISAELTDRVLTVEVDDQILMPFPIYSDFTHATIDNTAKSTETEVALIILMDISGSLGDLEVPCDPALTTNPIEFPPIEVPSWAQIPIDSGDTCDGVSYPAYDEDAPFDAPIDGMCSLFCMAQEATKKILNVLPVSVRNVGLILFNYNDTQMVLSVGQEFNETNKNLAFEALDSVYPNSSTSFAQPMALARDDFNNNYSGTGEKHVILITDGLPVFGYSYDTAPDPELNCFENDGVGEGEIGRKAVQASDTLRTHGITVSSVRLGNLANEDYLNLMRRVTNNPLQGENPISFDRLSDYDYIGPTLDQVCVDHYNACACALRYGSDYPQGEFLISPTVHQIPTMVDQILEGITHAKLIE